MSGSGGFYKYRCKYFYTYNCPNWVYCNGHACAMCLAEGRDAAEAEAPAALHGHPAASWQHPQHPGRHPQSQFPLTEICVPQAIHGVLRYTVMEIIPAEESGSGAYWVLRQKAMAPRPLPYSAITTSDTPRPVMSSVGVTGGQMAY
ncbi:hypothetical protein C8A05DRAFT_30558 [Staphylotrichum tortipilum]|uniref:Uncharacterized protein n=1 Tax=Staphylotrichum tortipilum TaxID=2831512 RepID=A0AAN6RW41_9PEZI|nr:hypothetical protein C8A05DRAFT_30558 [Staphylotrichum longicolle]